MEERSSELLRRGQLRLANNLFHIGVLFLFFGHLIGMLTPHFIYEPFISSGAKQLLAMVSGGIAGTLGFIGLTLLLQRRLFDERIRAASRPGDILIAVLLWLQLLLGLATIPISAQHLDGSTMLKLAGWAQHVVTFRGGAAALLADVGWVFKAHMFLGMTIFRRFCSPGWFMSGAVLRACSICCAHRRSCVRAVSTPRLTACAQAAPATCAAEARLSAAPRIASGGGSVPVRFSALQPELPCRWPRRVRSVCRPRRSGLPRQRRPSACCAPRGLR